ncbi:MAG: IPT/TIG domain-containing protein [Actinobacteria bacterium]|nr:IPT/TIG domain-containing protein [Actinomycetota bacterium]
MFKQLGCRWKWGVLPALLLPGIFMVPTAVALPASVLPVSATTTLTLGPMVHLPALVSPPLPAGAHLIGDTSPAQVMTVDIVLKPSNSSGLSSLVSSLYDPRSPLYRHFLTPGQFQREFGPSNMEKYRMSEWLDEVGLAGGKWIGSAFQVHTTAAKASQALGIHVMNIHMPTGRIAYNAYGTPTVPATISNDISAILGLSTVAQMKPALTAPARGSISKGSMFAGSSGTVRHRSVPPSLSAKEANPGRVRLSSVDTSMHSTTKQSQTSEPTPCTSASNYASSSGSWLPNQVGDAYGINSLLAGGYDGSGVTVAVYELAAHSVSDVATYESCFGLTNPVSTVAVDGGGVLGGRGTGEADLDIEQVATQAPGASIISYEGPINGSGPYDTYNAIVQADQAQIISTSWGSCESSMIGSGYMSALDSLFSQAAAQGQSIFASAGDHGSEDCYSASSSNPDTYLNVDYPASDPYVTGVGGTELYFNGSQPVWNYCQSDESLSCASDYNGYNAGGGGLSIRWPEPSWQDGFNTWYWTPNANGSYPQCGEYCRGVPDIAANAGYPEAFYVNGRWGGLIGTSMAAPLLAGMFADITNTCYYQVGDANPALYAYAGISGAYGVAFDGVSQGNNDMTGTNGGDYPASSSGGWSPASGLGTPIASGLACPEITSVQPPDASAGIQVTVTGSNLSLASFYFVTPSGAATKATVVSSSPGSATLVVPAGSGQVVIDAGTPIGYGKYNQSFTYVTSVTSVTGPDPSTSIAGATGVTYKISFTTSSSGALAANSGTITLSGPTGTIFPSVASDYTINGTVATAVTGAGSNAVTITTPVAIGGSAPVDVVAGNVANPSAGTYTLAVSTSSDIERVSTPNYAITPPPVPTITGLSPSSGSTEGDTKVVVTGTYFSSVSAVYFGRVAASSYTVDSSTEITAISPAESAGTVEVTVDTSAGTSPVSGTSNFTYVAPPTVASIIPGSSPLQGGGTVTITGTGLSGATALHFGSVSAANLSVVSPTELTATIPASQVAGTTDVTVTTPGGISPGVGFVYVTAGIRYVPVTPYRIVDTRCTQNPLPSGITSTYCSGLPSANQSLSSPLAGKGITAQVAGTVSGSSSDAVPYTAQSVVLNITAIASPSTQRGYITVYPTGTNVPTASSLNYVPGMAIPNLVTATLGKAGSVSILPSSAGVNIVVDVEGYYEPATSQPSNLFNPLPLPARILDTRCVISPISAVPRYCAAENLPAANASIPEPAPKSAISIAVAGLSGSGVPSDATAISLVVTAAGPHSGGYLTVWADSGSSCGIPPMASNVNFRKGTASANSVIVETAGTGKICIFNSADAPTNVVVDINGYFSSSGDAFTPSSPVRICDTRALSISDVASGVTGHCANSGTALQPASGPIAVQVTGIAGIPSSAKAVVANVTVTNTAGAGYLRTWAAGETQPSTSNINWASGETMPNMVTVTLSASGAINVYTSADVNIIIDVVGWYS